MKRVTTSDYSESDKRDAARSDIRSCRLLVWATVILWLANFGILTLRSLFERPDAWGNLIVPRLFVALVGVGFCYILHLALRYVERHGLRWQLAAAALLAPAAAEAYAWFITLFVRIVFGAEQPVPPGSVVLELALHLWFFATWIGFYLAISYSARLRRQERREARAHALAQAAQLQALYYQVSPHFLFNTLNALASLIADRRNDQAEEMVERLANFLRLTLELDPNEDVTLDCELSLQRAYLEVERVRFPDLRLDIEADPAIADMAVPSLILQPLVENAIKHGVSRHLGPAHIGISAHRREELLDLVVTNRAPPPAAMQPLGIGLRNVRERLHARFGERSGLSAEFTPPDQFVVRLSLPLVRI